MREILRNLLRRKVRSTLTISGIVIGIFALTTMGAMAEHFNALIDGGVKYFGGNVQVGAPDGQASLLPLSKLDELAKSARHASFRERVRLNQEFHLAIAEASGSKRLLAMVRSFREYFLSARWVSRQESKLFKRAVEDHKKIVAALRAKSPERVERALRAHLKIGWDELKSSTNVD